jgi:acetoacetate decarboxylase
MPIPLDQIKTMPAFSPYYPLPPARYRNTKSQTVYFRAAESAIDRVLPECFEPSGDGTCMALGLTVPWSANYGAFDESVLSVKCTYEGQEGWFSPVAFLNSKSSIPAGREIYGTPKVWADFEIGFAERVMYTNTNVAGTSLMSIRTTMQREASADEMPNSDHAWRLKVIPRADGNGVDVMQIIDGANAKSDEVIHVQRAGDGVVQFNPSPIYDLSDFTPLEYFGAYYVESDLTENWAEIVHDFLKD